MAGPAVEILSTRVFSVSRERLYEAFADPEKLALWWGPEGFTNRIVRFELAAGGQWHVTMTNSEGLEFANRSTFEDVIPGERICYVHHEPLHVFTMIMTFADAQDGARLTWRMLFPRNAEILGLKKFVALANEQNFDRLQSLLNEPAGAGPD